VTSAGHARPRGRVPVSDAGTRTAAPVGATRPAQDAGYSLAELLIVLALLAAGGAWSIALIASAEREMRLTGAARLLATCCAQARAEAVRRAANVAIAFAGAGSNPELHLVVDGNGNGVRRAEVDSGADPVIRRIGRVGEHFRGVRFEITAACPEVDGTEPLVPGSDAVRVGASDLLVFTPLGTSSGGTAYLSGEAPSMVAVRVLGATGRVRALRCGAPSGRWGTL
jgi:hypothetical protein